MREKRKKGRNSKHSRPEIINARAEIEKRKKKQRSK